MVKISMSEEEKDKLKRLMLDHKINLNYFTEGFVSISINETTTTEKIDKVVAALYNSSKTRFQIRAKKPFLHFQKIY